MSSDAILQFAEAGKTYPPQRTPLRQLWSHLHGHGRDNGMAGGYTALQSLSFEVFPGQSLGIVGLNGAGKSTLLQLAAGTLTPSSGKVHTGGRIAALLELGSGFNPEATGLENIYLYAATMGMSRAQVAQRLDDIIEFSGLRDALDMPVKTYSSGMQVRLAFSVATSVDPDILIVDEALSVGDGVFAKRSFDRVIQLRERGTALLLCSHALFHIDLFCERTMWLDKGTMRAFGPTSQILPRYQEFLDEMNGGAGIPQPRTETAPSDSYPATALPEVKVASRPELARLVRAEVRLDGVAGKELHGKSLQSCLEVDVHLQVSREESPPRVALVISSDTGKIIGSTFCDADAVRAHDERGNAHTRFTLAKLPLNKGRYRLGIYLLSADGRFVYEWLDPYAHLEMQSSSVHQGPWIIPGDWCAQESSTTDKEQSQI